MMKRTHRTALVAIILLTLALLSPGGVLANGPDWQSPSQNTPGTGGGLGNPANAYADDAAYASKCFSGGGTAQHVYYDYDLGLDPCDIVDGIEVRLDWWLDTLTDDSTMSVELSWDGGTTWTAAKTDANRTLAEHTVVLGGPADDWGHAWTADELSNANFRVRVTVYDTDT
jgi:hypothetical protein